MGDRTLLKLSSVPLTVDARVGVDEAARVLQQRHVGSIVVTESDEPVGLLTDRDIALGALRRPEGSPLPTAGDLASRPLRTLPASAPLEEATRLMGDARIRRVGLVGADGSLVGVLALDSVVQHLAFHADAVARTLRRELREEREPTQGAATRGGAE